MREKSDLLFFVTVHSITIALQRQNIYEPDIRYELYFTICILLSAFVGWYTECTNVHGVHNIKNASTEVPLWMLKVQT